VAAKSGQFTAGETGDGEAFNYLDSVYSREKSNPGLKDYKADALAHYSNEPAETKQNNNF